MYESMTGMSQKIDRLIYVPADAVIRKVGVFVEKGVKGVQVNQLKGGKYNFYVEVKCCKINRHIKSEDNLPL